MISDRRLLTTETASPVSSFSGSRIGNPVRGKKGPPDAPRQGSSSFEISDFSGWIVGIEKIMRQGAKLTRLVATWSGAIYMFSRFSVHRLHSLPVDFGSGYYEMCLSSVSSGTVFSVFAARIPSHYYVKCDASVVRRLGFIGVFRTLFSIIYDAFPAFALGFAG